MTTPASAEPTAAEIQAALDRSEAWERGFVEALGLCPYARPCRESGRLHRRVLGCRGGPAGTPGFAELAAAAAGAVRAIEALPEDAVEVAFLLFPSLDERLARGASGAREFGRLPAAVAAALGERSRFHCVAFHPDLPEDLADEHRAVGICRRSPDPMLQLVRASTLDALRGPQGSVFHAAGAPADLPSPPEPLSLGIARRNLATLRHLGLERVRALLASFRRRS